MKTTRPMPENTVDQIEGGAPADEFSEIRGETPGGLIETLAKALGVSAAKVTNVLGGVVPGKSKLNATCPKCKGKYKYFSDEGYTEDQSICPACRDEAMSVEREAAMRPEKLAAAKRLKDQEAAEAAKKDQSRRETIELVAETVSQVLANKAKA